MGVEGRRRGVLQVAAHHDAAPQTGLFGAHHERLVAFALKRLADGSVAGLVARCKRRRRGGRVGHAVVGRARADQPHALCAVERGRRVAVLDHQHRDMGQTHAVAHHENQVADLALGVRGPDTAPRKEAQRPDKQDCRSLLHNRYKDSPFSAKVHRPKAGFTATSLQRNTAAAPDRLRHSQICPAHRSGRRRLLALAADVVAVGGVGLVGRLGLEQLARAEPLRDVEVRDGPSRAVVRPVVARARRGKPHEIALVAVAVACAGYQSFVPSCV